ncbi:MAG TPA: tetratricopeptide repeat protein [Steroidobacteraceae bacterium]|nr:tetratricopeptide repeat protein [Steroidobacteraceae bacterium]
MNQHRTFMRGLMVLGWLAVALTAGCGGAESRYLDHLDRGKQFLAADNLDKAAIEFRNALQIRPKSAEALYLNGQVAERRGNVRGAVGLYESAIEVNPDFPAPVASLGRIYAFAGLPEKALTLIAPALAKHPDDVELLTVRAAAHLQSKDAAAARADALRAVQLAPANKDAVALLAALYRQDGDLERAITMVREAVGREPSSVDLRGVLANLYLDSQQPAQAEEQLRQIVNLRPRDLPSRYRLALFYTNQRRLDDAQRVLNEAVKAQPDSSEAKLALVEFVSTQRSKEAGEQTLRNFIAADPNDYELQLALGALLERDGATQDALRVYRELIARGGSDAPALTARDEIAAIESRRGNYEAAGKLIEEVLSTNPRDNAALVLRSDIEMQRQNPAAAIADLRSVLRDQPQAIPIRRALARAYMANGEPALAEEMLRDAMDAAPTDPDVRIQLAQLLLQTDRIDQAVPLLEETVRRAPTTVPARELLVRAYMAKQDWVAARVAAEDLKSLQPTMAVGFYLSGSIARAQNRLDDARRDWQHALEVQPGAIDALSALARLQVASGQAAQAVARVEQLVAQQPRNAAALDLLGQLYVSTNRTPQAIEVLTRAIQAAPTWWYPYRTLAVAYLAQKDPQRALQAYQDGIKAVPDAEQLTFELASFHERQGRIDDAISLYERLYERNPASARAADALAMLLVTYKTDQRSLDRARDVTRRFADSDDGILLDANGWVRFKRGEYADALPVLQRAAQRAPDSKIIRYHLGMAELHQGERVRARSDLETALSGSAKFAGADEARTALASLEDRTG